MYIFTSKYNKIIIYNKLINLLELSNIIIKYSKNIKIWLINGSLGSGKTTLISNICKQLGVKSIINSPTYSYVNEYKYNKFKKIYHFDFYRIKNYNDIFNIDYEYYFYSGNYCFIEWPLRFYNIIPDKHLFINIKVNLNNTRTLKINLFP